MLSVRAALRGRVSVCRASQLRHKSTMMEGYSPTFVVPHTARTISAALPRPVGFWLLGVGGLVAGMVTVGGITRLTRSGLSMTDWKLQGSLPPMNLAEWEREFERYKQYPEWQQRKSMTLDEFKFIYYWEWGHRMMGRGIGLAFTVPLLVFAARGMIPRAFAPRMALLFSLGGGQGLIGWWMVKSGLEKVENPSTHKEIRVSPYRLATHLTMAFTTYTAVLWTALEAFNTPAQAVAVAASIPASQGLRALALRRGAIFCGALTACTIVSGAFVAGNDAGRAFNTFPIDGTPWMDGQWIPDEVLALQPVWRNFFENTATVQLDHRVLALSTLASVAGLFATARRSAGGMLWAALPTHARRMLQASAGMAVVQVGLGISTLLLYVPLPLAATHQFGSLVLLTTLTGVAHSLNFAKYSRAVGVGVAAAAKAVK